MAVACDQELAGKSSVAGSIFSGDLGSSDSWHHTSPSHHIAITPSNDSNTIYITISEISSNDRPRNPYTVSWRGIRFSLQPVEYLPEVIFYCSDTIHEFRTHGSCQKGGCT